MGYFLMQEKVYILMTSSGAYDDYMTHIIGIYTSMEMAENGRSEYTGELNKFFEDNPCPVNAEIAEKIESYEVTIDDDDNPDMELYQDWLFKTSGVSEINKEAWIVEKILNKTDLDLIEHRTRWM